MGKKSIFQHIDRKLTLKSEFSDHPHCQTIAAARLSDVRHVDDCFKLFTKGFNNGNKENLKLLQTSSIKFNVILKILATTLDFILPQDCNIKVRRQLFICNN